MKYQIFDNVIVDDGDCPFEFEAMIIDYDKETQLYIMEDEDGDVFEVIESQILELA